MLRKLAENGLSYSKGSEVPPGKSETRRITGVRQSTGKFGGPENTDGQRQCRKEKQPVFLEYKVQEG